MLMGGVVVEDHVDKFADRDLRLDAIQERTNLMPLMLQAATDHLAFEHIRERSNSMLLLIMGQGACAALFHRQPGLVVPFIQVSPPPRRPHLKPWGSRSAAAGTE